MKKIIYLIGIISVCLAQQGYVVNENSISTFTTISGQANITTLKTVNTNNLVINSSLQLNQSEYTPSNQVTINFNSPVIYANNLPVTQTGIYLLGLDVNNNLILYRNSTQKLTVPETEYQSVQSMFFESPDTSPLKIGDSNTANIILGVAPTYTQNTSITFNYSSFNLTKDTTISSLNTISLNNTDPLILTNSFTINGTLLLNNSSNTITAKHINIDTIPSVSGYFSNAASIDLTGMSLQQTNTSLSTTLIFANQIIDINNESITFNGIPKAPSTFITKYNYLAVDENGTILLKKNWSAPLEIRNSTLPVNINPKKNIFLGLEDETIIINAATKILTNTITNTTPSQQINFTIPCLFFSENTTNEYLLITVEDTAHLVGKKITNLYSKNIIIEPIEKINTILVNQISLPSLETKDDNAESFYIIVADEKGLIGKLKINNKKKITEIKKWNQKIHNMEKKIDRVNAYYSWYLKNIENYE